MNDTLRDTRPLRLCPNERCRRVLLPADEARGRCALCGWWLLTLVKSMELSGFSENEKRDTSTEFVKGPTSNTRT